MEIKKFKNAFGIKELEFIQNDRFRNHIIYASNGTFKSSFTKTMELWGEGRGGEVIDRLSKELFEGEIKFNGSDQNHNDSFDSCLIYKVEREEDDFFNNIQNLIVSKEMQTKLVDAKKGISDIEKTFNDSLKKCKINSQKYFDEFYGDEKESFYKIHNAINSVISHIELGIDLKNIDFGQFFTKAYVSLNSVEVKESLDKYAKTIKNRTESEIFDDNFNEANLNDVVKNIKKNNFIDNDKKRSISIGENIFNSIEELELFYSKVIKEIFEGEDVLAAYNSVKKQLGAAKAVKKIDKNLKDLGFIEAIQKDRQVLCNERIKKEFSIDDLIKLRDELNSIKTEIDVVYESAVKIVTDFEIAITEFKDKFNPVFDISITNVADSVLGIDTPKIIFTHNSNVSIQIEKSELDNILSSGEKSALYILEFIFRLNWKLKNHSGKLLVIMDDVIETFDYSNRNGFIEYINELSDLETLNVLVLTHNFEFYKSLRSRCAKTMFPYVAERNDSGKITIIESFHFANSIRKYFKNVDTVKSVLLSIPFAREIMGNIGDETTILTSCLHYKKDTNHTLENIIDNLCELFHIEKSGFTREDLGTLYYDLLLSHCNYEYENEYDLGDKLIYSIASRVLIEKKAEEIKPGILDGITKYQTANLYRKVKIDSDFNDEFKKVLQKVVLITPSFIHINSFMYNPLVDITTKEYYELLNSIISI